jgi:hypothetical protein
MNTTTRTAVAAAALTLSVSPLVLATPASAERVRVADVTVSTVERDVGAARQQQAYLDRLLAAARDAEGGAGQSVAPPWNVGSGGSWRDCFHLSAGHPASRRLTGITPGHRPLASRQRRM